MHLNKFCIFNLKFAQKVLLPSPFGISYFWDIQQIYKEFYNRLSNRPTKSNIHHQKTSCAINGMESSGVLLNMDERKEQKIDVHIYL